MQVEGHVVISHPSVFPVQCELVKQEHSGCPSASWQVVPGSHGSRPLHLHDGGSVVGSHSLAESGQLLDSTSQEQAGV